MRTGRIGHSKDCTNTLSACDEGDKGQKASWLVAKRGPRINFYFEIRLNNEETSLYKPDITSLAVRMSS